ncbi:MAG: DUF885 domain-containing protein [Chthoniobacterales bacterium]
MFNARFLLRFALLTGCWLLPVSAQSNATPTDSLHALFDEAWAFRMEQSPVEASYLGDRRHASEWDKLALADFDARREKYQSYLKKLTDIDREKLPPNEKLNFDLFDKEMSLAIEESLLGLQCLQITPRGGLQTDNELADALTFATVADYEAWIARLQAFPEHAAQVTALLRDGMQRNILFPKILMKRVGPQIDKQITDSPKDSPFYQPFRKFPDAIAPIDRARLAGAAEDAISASVIPAFKKFKKFYQDEYLPACPEKTGFANLKNGKEIYAFLVRRETTTDLAPEKIHELGLGEVARIRAEMEKVKTEAGFQGTLDEFFKFLRTDPQFFCKSGDELLQRYRATAKRIDPLLPKLFHTLPRLPYGVEPIPDIAAPDTTAAYYREGSADGSRAGTFFVNLYKPETRATWEMIPLTLHEAVPGHHIQISLAMEQTDLPNFRRYGGYTAFVEGWGLYAETLGYDLDLYQSPYDKMGQLSYEMWRAVRLVTDTGLHALGWDRQKAIDYFKANTPRSELDITNEVDRYLSMPGQALAYKIGQLKITQLRDEAALALGPQFDLREYHDLLMKMGAVPLDIMERDVKAWVNGKAKAANISTIPR